MSTITSSELAVELGTTARVARKFLRSITPREEQPGKGSRWAIDGSKRHLTGLQKQYKVWFEAEQKARAERAAKAAAEAAEAVTAD